MAMCGVTKNAQLTHGKGLITKFFKYKNSIKNFKYRIYLKNAENIGTYKLN